MKRYFLCFITVLLITCLPALSYASLSDGLIGYFPFEQNTNDLSGYNHSGVIYGEPEFSEDRFGNTDSALSFDGEDDFMEVDHNYSFEQGDFSISFWVNKAENTTTNYDNCWGVTQWNGGGGTPGENEWLLSIGSYNTDLPIFGVEIGTNIYHARSSDPITIGEWHHIAGIRQQDYIMLYVDGILEDSTEIGSASINSSGKNLRIANSALDYYHTNAAFDEIRIYNRALSEAEVKQLSAVPLPGSFWLLGLAIIGFAGVRPKNKNRAA